MPWGINDGDPINIRDIYKIQVDNPRLTLYVPDRHGSQLELDLKRPGVSVPRWLLYFLPTAYCLLALVIGNRHCRDSSTASNDE